MRPNQTVRKLVPFLFVTLWSVLPASAQNVGVGAIAGNVTDASGQEIGQGILRFSYRRHFWPFLRSFRTTRNAPA